MPIALRRAWLLPGLSRIQRSTCVVIQTMAKANVTETKLCDIYVQPKSNDKKKINYRQRQRKETNEVNTCVHAITERPRQKSGKALIKELS